MLKKRIFAIAVLAAAASLAHAADDAKKDPKTGKACVTFVSSEQNETGTLLRMNFRNTCSSPFEIRIPVGANTRKKSIEAGSSDKPAKAYVTCKPNEGCEGAKWLYE